MWIPSNGSHENELGEGERTDRRQSQGPCKNRGAGRKQGGHCEKRGWRGRLGSGCARLSVLEGVVLIHKETGIRQMVFKQQEWHKEMHISPG